MIKVSNIYFAYEKEKFLFEDLSLHISKRTFLSVLGPNGSGKSTFLKILTQNLHFQKGNISWNLTPPLSQCISFVPQNSSFSFNFSVMDFLIFGRHPYKRFFEKPNENDFSLALSILKRMDIEHLSSKHISHLSGGEKRLIHIAQALIREPSLLILDEPLAGLDPFYEKKVLELLFSLYSENISVIYSVHQPYVAKLFSCECLMLQKGKILFFGKTKEIMIPQNLEKLYDTPFLPQQEIFSHL